MKKFLVALMVLNSMTAFAFGWGSETGTTENATMPENVPTVTEPEPLDEARQRQLDYLMTLGLIKYGNTLDASGSRNIMVLTRENSGGYWYQHLDESDGKSIERALEKRGMIQRRVNKETNRVEKHVLVHNPRDKNTNVWVPLAKAKETAQRIRETGKTLPEDVRPRRVNEADLQQMDLNTSF